MDKERLLRDLEKIYGKKPIKRDVFEKREALPSEVKKHLDKNGHSNKESRKRGLDS